MAQKHKAIPAIHDGHKTQSFVCFACRKHRAFTTQGGFHSKTERDSEDCRKVCSSCGDDMIWIGWKLQVPPKNKDKLWKEFETQVMAPGWPQNVDDEENKHFVNCKARNWGLENKNTETGCKRCDAVWKPLSWHEKGRWVAHWNIYPRGSCFPYFG